MTVQVGRASSAMGNLRSSVPNVPLGVADGVHGAVEDALGLAQRLLDLTELLEGVDVNLAHRALDLLFGLPKDVLAALARLIEDALLGDDVLGALARPLQDLRRLALRLGDDPLPLLDDAPRLLDLVRDGDAELVHEREEFLFLNHDPAAEGDALADPDQLLEPVDEVEDIHGPVVLRLVVI